jgi:hypothetical protein
VNLNWNWMKQFLSSNKSYLWTQPLPLCRRTFLHIQNHWSDVNSMCGGATRFTLSTIDASFVVWWSSVPDRKSSDPIRVIASSMVWVVFFLRQIVALCPTVGWLTVGWLICYGLRLLWWVAALSPLVWGWFLKFSVSDLHLCWIFVCWLHFCLKQIFKCDVGHDVPTSWQGSVWLVHVPWFTHALYI